MVRNLSAFGHEDQQQTGMGLGDMRRFEVRVLSALLTLTAAATLAALPPSDDTPVGVDDVAHLRRLAMSAVVRDVVRDRPAYRSRPNVPVNLASVPGPPGVDVGKVKTVPVGGQRIRLAVPDGALPWRYLVDPDLVRQFGLEAIIRGISAWDGIPGSRWATEFAGLAPRSLQTAVADGHSTIYRRRDCPGKQLGAVRWQLHPDVAALEVRNGTGAVFSSEVDIGVCPRVRSATQLVITLRHEVGHVIGQAHVCERHGRCPRPVGGVPASCRVMFWQLNGCATPLREADRDMVRHLYPALPRLWGADAIQAAARVSYATVATGQATHAILATVDFQMWQLAPAVLLSSLRDAPLLLDQPDPVHCVSAPVGQELARMAAIDATVHLVGGWPTHCDGALAKWGLRVQRAWPTPGPSPQGSAQFQAQLRAADQVRHAFSSAGEPSNEVVLAPLPQVGAHPRVRAAQTAVGWSAVAFAAVRRAPVLFIDGQRISPSFRVWLARRPDVNAVFAIGGVTHLHPLLLADLRRLGLRTRRVAGSAPTHITLRMLKLMEADRPIVVSPLDAPQMQAVGASLAARTAATMVVVNADHAAVDWMADRTPSGGALVASPSQVAYRTQSLLAPFFQPAVDSRLNFAWRPRKAQLARHGDQPCALAVIARWGKRVSAAETATHC